MEEIMLRRKWGVVWLPEDGLMSAGWVVQVPEAGKAILNMLEAAGRYDNPSVALGQADKWLKSRETT